MPQQLHDFAMVVGIQHYPEYRALTGPVADAQAFAHWLLVRRSLRDPGARAYYVVFAPADVSLAELAGVAGLRWTIETCFETAKTDLGLDHCEARSWHAWHRHMTLVMAAFAFLAKLRADLLRTAMPEAAPCKGNERSLHRVGAHS